MKWADIESNESYLSKSEQEKAAIKADFFNDFVSVDPEYDSLPKDAKSKIKSQFIPEFSISRVGSQMYRNAAQGLADMAQSMIAEERSKDFEERERMLQETGRDVALEQERVKISDVLTQAAIAKGAPSDKAFPLQDYLSEGEISDLRVAAQKGQSKEYIESLRGFAEKMPEPLPGQSSGIGGVVEQAAGGVARFAPGMAVTAMNLPAGTAATFGQLYGQKYGELFDATGDHERSREAALMSAALNTPLEQAGTVIELGVFKKLLGGAGKGLTGKAKDFAKALLKSATTEGFEEFLQQYPDEIANIYALNPEMSAGELVAEVSRQIPSITKEATKAAGVGAVGGLMMAGGAQVASMPIDISKKIAEKGDVQKAKPSATKEQVLQSMREDLASGVLDEESVKSLTPSLQETYGVEQSEIDDIVGFVRKETAPVEFKDKVGTAKDQASTDTQPAELFQPQTKSEQDEIEREIMAQREGPGPIAQAAIERQKTIETEKSDYEKALDEFRQGLKKRVSGVVPGAETDIKQQGKEILRRQGIELETEPQTTMALPEGQGFELRGGQYTPGMLPATAMRMPGPKETKDAGEIRKDAGQIQERGVERQISKAEGREDLQQPEKEGPEAGYEEKALKPRSKKERVKKAVTDNVKTGDIDGAVRFTTPEEMYDIVDNGRIRPSDEYGATFASRVMGQEDTVFPAYGKESKSPVAVIFPKDSIVESGTSKDVTIKQDVNPRDLRFIVSGSDRVLTFDEISAARGRKKKATKIEPPKPVEVAAKPEKIKKLAKSVEKERERRKVVYGPGGAAGFEGKLEEGQKEHRVGKQEIRVGGKESVPYSPKLRGEYKPNEYEKTLSPSQLNSVKKIPESKKIEIQKEAAKYDAVLIGYENGKYWIHDNKTGSSGNLVESANEIKSKLKENRKPFDQIIGILKNETGSSELANDVWRKGADILIDRKVSFVKFNAKMRKAFSDIWSKIKKHMRTLFDIINNQRGSITIERTRGPVTEKDYDENRKLSRGIKIKSTTGIARVASELAEGTDKYLGAISTRLGNINKKLKHKLRKLDFDIGIKSSKDADGVLPLLKKAKKKMSGKDFADWDYARKNSDTDKIWFLAEKYGLRDEYKKYREVLDKLRKEGLDVGLDIGLIPEYAPRVLKDKKGFLQALYGRKDWDVYSKALREKAQLLGLASVSELSEDQRADIISNMIAGQVSGLGGVSATKSRRIQKIPPELNKFYMDSDSALVNHIYSMRKAIELRKFFGKVPQKVSEMKTRLRNVQRKQQEIKTNLSGKLSKAQKKALSRYESTIKKTRLSKKEKDALQRKIDRLNAVQGGTLPNKIIRELERRKNRYIGLEKEYTAYIGKYADQRDFRQNIGAYVLDLITSGQIKPEQEKTVHDILVSRFHEVGTHGLVQLYKNFSYIDTMGSPISALTQIGDLAWSAYDAGLLRTAKGAIKSLAGKSKITKEDIGVDRIAQEFVDPGTLGRAVEKVFKYTQLERMDKIGKEALMNAALEKYQKMARKRSGALKAKLKPIFENETNALIKDLARGEITDNVKLLVYNRLLDFQPVALSEMPQKYLDAGNGRIFYMLKTFTLKQFDVYRNEVYNKIKTGTRSEKIEGLRNLIRLSIYFVLANATADEIKDFVLNRKTEMNDRVVDNILRLFGVSKFITWQARREGIGTAALKQILPPAQFIDSVYKDIVTDEETPRIIKSVPVIGKIMYWHMKAAEGD